MERDVDKKVKVCRRVKVSFELELTLIALQVVASDIDELKDETIDIALLLFASNLTIHDE